MLFFIKFMTILFLSETLATPQTDEDGWMTYTPGVDTLKGNLATYTLIKQLGEGGFAKVVEAKDQTNIPKAIKIMNSKSGTYFTKQEERILETIKPLESKHICKIVESFEAHGHTCFVFEKLGPSLKSLIQVLEQNEFELRLEHIRQFLNQLLPDVKLLHDKNIVHRDINTINVLLDRSKYDLNSDDPENTKVHIIDFGISKFLKDCTDPEDAKKLDVQTIGATILELLDFKTPSELYPENKEKYEAHLKSSLSEIAAKGPEYKQIHDLLGKMLKFNSHERITLPDVLKHKFLTEHTSQPLIKGNSVVYL